MGIKYAVNESFFTTWSQVVAYVLGYLFADGNVQDVTYMRGKYVQVSSIDRSTIIKMKKWLGSKHKIIKTMPRSGQGRRQIQYRLKIGSHKLYNDLYKLGLHPRKSLVTTLPRVPTKYLPHFVRGYFDGDGCAFFEKALGKQKQVIVKRFSIIFTSGSLVFLEQLCAILHSKLKLNQKKVYSSHRSFQLRYSTNDSIKICRYMYKGCGDGVYLTRKVDILRDYYSFRKDKQDKTMRQILALR